MNTDIGHEYIEMYLGNSMNQYGVLGMKWGVHHRRRKLANIKYHNEKTKLKNKKVSQEEYKKRVYDLKRRRKINKTSKSRDVDIANELYPAQNKELNKKIVKEKMPKTFLKAATAGNLGTIAYDNARTKGNNRLPSYIYGRTVDVGNQFGYGAPGAVLYSQNLYKRYQNRKKAIAEGTNDPYLQPTKVKRKKKSK